MESTLLLFLSLILTSKLILLLVVISLLFIGMFVFRLILHGEFVLCWMLLIGNVVVLSVLLIVFFVPISGRLTIWSLQFGTLILDWKSSLLFSGNLISWWTTFSKFALDRISFGNFTLVIWSTFFVSILLLIIFLLLVSWSVYIGKLVDDVFFWSYQYSWL